MLIAFNKCKFPLQGLLEHANENTREELIKSDYK
jgi:hypothetical protein